MRTLSGKTSLRKWYFFTFSICYQRDVKEQVLKISACYSMFNPFFGQANFPGEAIEKERNVISIKNGPKSYSQ